ncbi:hypothetical protein KNT64_gp098 [Pseudomonas phage PspYZU05]|uniref:Uncharacterized protein n=1 Tax=Pseudomonas phage PspYZU05 TaxID=1983556 RepID=A0A2U7N2G6_9CAUD|nr:hypothetical protein KNT64_gp098 [Pseudomonas phage PspYZU05]ASD52050.1 hypothetical protein PspYZU05_98 [Pseudomonas phage PspYZU05]
MLIEARQKGERFVFVLDAYRLSASEKNRFYSVAHSLAETFDIAIIDIH